MKHIKQITLLFLWKCVFAVAILMMCTAVFIHAGHGIKKGGQDLYWKNWIALADDDAFVNDSLVPSFLDATESFLTNSTTGGLVTGSQRRTYSPDRQVGWLLVVNRSVEVKSEGGKFDKLYAIEALLVFDFRVEEK